MAWLIIEDTLYNTERVTKVEMFPVIDKLQGEEIDEFKIYGIPTISISVLTISEELKGIHKIPLCNKDYKYREKLASNLHIIREQSKLWLAQMTINLFENSYLDVTKFLKGEVDTFIKGLETTFNEHISEIEREE